MVPSGRERAQINDMVKYNLGQYQLKVIPEVLRYGTIHKGRPHYFRDFQTPPPPFVRISRNLSVLFVQNLAILKPPSVRTSSMYGPLTFINTNHNSANIEMVLKGFKIFLYNLGPRQRCAYKPII